MHLARNTPHRWRNRLVALMPALLIASLASVASPAGAAESASQESAQHPDITSVGVGAAERSLGIQSNATKGKDVVVFVRASAPTSVPGGSAGFFVVVSNSGKQATGGATPTSITLTIPEGTTFASITDLSGTGFSGVPTNPASEAGATWHCATPSNGGSTVKCVWGTGGATGAVTPAPIAAESAIPAFVELHVDNNFSTSASGVERALKVAVSAPGDDATSDTTSSAAVLIQNGDSTPIFYPDFAGSPTVSVGEQATEVARVLNVGSGPAVGSTDKPTLQLTNLLPEKVLGDWDASGTNWTCTGPATAPPTCTYTATSLPVGGLTTPLTIRYHLDGLKVAKLDLTGTKPHVEDWNIGMAGHAKSGNRPTSTFPNQIAIAQSPGSSLRLEAAFAGGDDVLVPGSSRTIDVKIFNIGAVATSGAIAITGTLPLGIDLKGQSADEDTEAAAAGSSTPWLCTAGKGLFSCEPTGEVSIEPGKFTMLHLNVTAPANVKIGAGIFSLVAAAQNQVSGIKPTPVSLPFTVLQDNVGYPALSLFTATGNASLSPSVDGAPASFMQHGAFKERLDVTDAGGAAIAAGSKATITQKFTKGVSIKHVFTPPGEQCTSANSSLTCTVNFKSAVAPRESIAGPTITVSANNATSGVVNWPASVRLSEDKAPAATKLDVLAKVGSVGPKLTTALESPKIPSAGGVGTWSVAVTNNGNAATQKGVRVNVALPKGVSALNGTGKTWSCNPNSGVESCTTQGVIKAGATLPLIFVSGKVPAIDGNRSYTVTASASSGSNTKPVKDAMTLIVRKGIHAVIKAPDQVVFDDVPLTSPTQKITPSTVTLEGDGSGGNGLGLTYTWTQRCTTAHDSLSKCSGVTPKVAWVNQAPGTTTPHTEDVEFTAPPVKKMTTLIFELAVSDGSTSSNTFEKIKIVPPTPASQGFNLEKPHPTKMKSEGPATETMKLPAPDEKATDQSKHKVKAKVVKAKVTAFTTNPNGEHAHLTADRSHDTGATGTGGNTGTAAGNSGTAQTHGSTGATGTSGSGGNSGSTGASGTAGTSGATGSTGGLAGTICNLIKSAANGQGFSADLPGGISISFSNINISGTGCGTGASFSFSNSSLKIGSLISATGVAGTVSASGVNFTAGTLSGPTDWKAPAFGMAGGAGGTGLSLSLNNGNLVLSGSVVASGFAFLPLPSGWNGTTKLTFDASSAGYNMAFAASATGPASDTSVNTALPTVSLNGTISSNGTFSLAAAMTGVVQLQGSSIDLSGTIARATPGGPITKSITGSLGKPLTITNGLSLDSLTVTIAPTDSSLGLTGSGVVTVTSGSTSVGVAVNLSYTDPKNWTLNVAGTGTKTWTPLPGLTVSPSDAHGSISAVDDKYQFSLTFAPQTPWVPKTGITITNMTLGLSNVCPDSGAPCPTGASLFLTIGGDAALNLPAVGTAQASLKGVLALPTGAFSVEASLTGSLAIGGGISITGAKLEMNKGFTVPTGEATPTVDTADPAGLSISFVGAVTIPKIGSIPSVTASYSSSGWVMTANLGAFSLPGASGTGTSLKDTVIGWSSYATSMKVVDPTTKQSLSIPIPANAFEISGSYASPDWFKKLFKLSGDVNGRATGQLNLSTGDFALKMSLTAAPNWYLYGNSTSSTSVRVDSAYFNIERSGASFQVAVGGSAALIAPGIPASAALQLGIGVGYNATTSTVDGTFTLDSKTGWQNAFGINGLTLSALALSFQLNLATLTPALGIGATAILPPAIRDPLGMPANVKTTVVANISLTNPCLGIEITDPSNSGQNVLSIGSGALTAKQFQLEIAPSGCTVGNFKYAPGVSLNFNGTVVGVSVAVAATLSVSPFKLDASVNVGDFTVGGVLIKQTSIVISAAPSSLSIKLAGGVNLLGANINVSGSYALANGVSTVDLHGTLDKLALGSTFSVQNVVVDAHVVTGPKPTVQFSAAGMVNLLGSNVQANLSLSVVNGQLIEVKSAIAANITIGGANGVNLVGTFNLDYGPSIPLAIDGKVNVKVGGYTFADATVALNSTSFTLTANFSIANVFTAQISGAMYYGTPAAGTKITGPNNSSVVAQTGDFLLSAKDVKFNIGGFSTSGTVQVGRAGGTPWGGLAASLALVGGSANNSVAVAGTFSGNGDFSLSGSGNLSLLGITANTAVSVSKTGANVAVSGQAGLSVLGSNISVKGDFASNNGSPQFRLQGTGNLNVGGFSLASSVKYSNFPADAGLSASINTRVGSVLTLAGNLSILANGGYNLTVNTNLDLKIAQVPASVVFTNCNYTSTVTYVDAPGILGSLFHIKIPQFSNPVCNSLKTPTLDASATVTSGGFSFGVTAHIDGNGNFRATASSPASGTYTGNTGSLNLAVVQFYASLSYSMSITITNTSPYISVQGSGSGAVYGRTYDVGFFYAHWGGWGQIVSVSASISINPTHVCGSARVWGVSFGPACI